MIIFKTIRYKNFLSSGNSFTEIELNRNKSTLVVGQNGAGKSTMLDALSFALFGRKIILHQFTIAFPLLQLLLILIPHYYRRGGGELFLLH